MKPSPTNEKEFTIQQIEELKKSGFFVQSFEECAPKSVPDLHVAKDGNLTWIEAKFLRDGVIKFEDGQRDWIKRFCEKNSRSSGTCLLLVFDPEEGMVRFMYGENVEKFVTYGGVMKPEGYSEHLIDEIPEQIECSF